MPRIKFIEPDGTEHIAEIASGMSVMHAAIKFDIPGIDADCKGSCTCSTCHVHVDRNWIERTGHAHGMEEDILDHAVNADDCSRLSCQIVMTDELDGICVFIPDWQR